MTDEELIAKAREALTDEEIIAKARAVSKELRGRRGDFDRFAGWLMDWMADQLEGKPGYLAEAVAEVRAMLDANANRELDALGLPADHEVRQRIRAERLEIIDRLIAIDAAGHGARGAVPEALVLAWCKGCGHGTLSVPCPRCGGPACAGCGRCPPCDGAILEESND